jgi:hypothetical protein
MSTPATRRYDRTRRVRSRPTQRHKPPDRVSTKRGHAQVLIENLATAIPSTTSASKSPPAIPCTRDRTAYRRRPVHRGRGQARTLRVGGHHRRFRFGPSRTERCRKIDEL